MNDMVWILLSSSVGFGVGYVWAWGSGHVRYMRDMEELEEQVRVGMAEVKRIYEKRIRELEDCIHVCECDREVN